eukprot:12927503-Prorocentrum_lima.AAC.1
MIALRIPFCKGCKTWIRPFGPPRIIESDQEGGSISDEAKVFLSRAGTTLKEKGIGAHARMVERHHAILRQAFLKIRAQVEEEGLPLDGQ